MTRQKTPDHFMTQLLAIHAKRKLFMPLVIYFLFPSKLNRIEMM